MRTKKMRAALAAMALATAMVIGCAMPPIEATDYTPPAGMGALTLNFSEEIARATVLPDTTRASFTDFTFSFSPTLPGTPKLTYTKTEMEGLTTPYAPVFQVTAATTYTLIVTADIGTGDAAAIWDSSKTSPVTAINVASGGNQGVSIVLQAYEPAATGDGSANGTFQWTIANSIIDPPLTVADMAFTAITLGQTHATIDLLSDGAVTPAPQWSGSFALAPGYYYVDFTLDSTAGTRNFRHIVHIYQNMNSHLTYSFTPAHLALVSTTVTSTITYPGPTDYLPELALDTTTHGTGATVGSPITLSITGTQSVTITVNNASDPTSGAVTLPGPAVAPYSSIDWEWNGSSSSLTPQTAAIPGDRLIITANSAPFDVPTYQPWQLSVTGIVGGKPYLTEIWIQIVP